MLRDLSGNIEIPIRRPDQPEQRDRAVTKPLDSGSKGLRAADLPVQLTPTRSHLHQIFVARNVVLLAASIGVAGMAAAESALRSPWIAGVLGLVALLNLFTWLRLKRSVPVSYTEFLLQILADVMLLSAALCFSGGDASPFQDLYLVPLTIAAATLPWRHTLIVALAIVGCRELACHYYFPLPGLPAPDHEWVDLLVGGLIAYFAFSMARTSRRHEQALARIKESYLKQRHLTELGTMGRGGRRPDELPPGDDGGRRRRAPGRRLPVLGMPAVARYHCEPDRVVQADAVSSPCISRL
jgi:hypothetical protein